MYCRFIHFIPVFAGTTYIIKGQANSNHQQILFFTVANPRRGSYRTLP